MKFAVFILGLCSIALAAVMGCTQAYTPGTYNDYCGAKYPHPGQLDTAGIKLLANRRIQLRNGTPFSPQSADYAFQSAKIYYNDRVNHIHLYFNVQPDKNGKLTSNLICSRGVTKHLKTFQSIPIPFVSDIQYDAQAKTMLIRRRHLSFKLGIPTSPNDFILRDVTIDQDATNAYVNGDPTNTYVNFANVRQEFGQVDPAKNNQFVLWSQADRSAPGQNQDGTGLNVRVIVYLTPTATKH